MQRPCDWRPCPISSSSTAPPQVLFVGCRGGISVFDERADHFRKLGDYHLGANTYTIAVDEQTQDLYLPINVGGRPVLRIAWYNPSGV